MIPAEWNKQSFLQITFPHEKSDWNYLLKEVSECFVEIIDTVSKYEDVLVVCYDLKKVKSHFKKNKNVYYEQIETNDTWTRDYAGITVIKKDKAIIQDFIFNGWGNKFEASLDNQITKKLFQKGIFQNCELKSFDFVLEGGSIESDGSGTILTTSKCLLSKQRNSRLSKKEIENTLKNNFGAERVLWLNHGFLSGDDTDSHIDTLARFGDRNTIIYTGCNDPNDEHYRELKLMKTELQQLINSNDDPYRLIELPLPDPCYDDEGNRLPATYANFIFINGAVIVPVYGVSQDEKALNILADYFSKRKVIPLNCRVLIEQHGSLHCVTMHYPEPIKLNKEILNENE